MRTSSLFKIIASLGIVGIVMFLGIVHVVRAATFTLPTNGVQSYTLQLQATVTDAPSITIEWPKETGVTNYTVYRKQKTDTSWGSVIATVPYDANATTYTYVDTNISIGTGYEYQVIKHMPTTPAAAYGYIYAGVKLPIVESRGKIILIIDSTFETDLASEIAQLKTDLAGDGWTVLSHSVGPTDSVTSVKALITADYLADPTNVKSVFLLGHVPVPYAGQLNPDAHANHLGAWPADMYYGDMGSGWTDVETWANSSQSRNTNIAGDGKFDQSNPPSEIELQVGRVDLSNMPAFGSQTELDLLRQYLVKNHNYKHRSVIATNRAILIDNFGVYGGESFALGSWRNFSTLVGSANIGTTANYFNTLSSNSYKWTSAIGSGTFTNITGFGSTSSYVTNSPRSVFTMLFGSYLGDWDTTNNLLRAPLASAGWGLASVWMGRPQWHFYHMGLGETIGYGAKVSQNNTTLYKSLSFVRDYDNQVHIALMGDPTLRNDTVIPPSSVSATNTSENNVDISWTASSDTGLSGYHLYRSTNQYGNYTRVTTSSVVGTAYTDTAPTSGGLFYYMVRAIKLETTPSGSYYNQSQGIVTSVNTPAVNTAPHISGLSSSETLQLPLTLNLDATITDDNLPTADTYTVLWSTVSGPGSVSFSTATNPQTTATFSSEGNYTIKITATDGLLSSEFEITVTVTLDTVSPSVPTDIQKDGVTTNAITLRWEDSTDNVGVVGYTVYRNGVEVGTSLTPIYEDTDLVPNTTYIYTIKAYDAATNTSSQSETFPATTSRMQSSGGGGSGSMTKTTPPSTTVASVVPIPYKTTLPFVFTKTLKKGMRTEEVRKLQEYLNAKGFTVSTYGGGSLGKETDLFGPATRAAVLRFQTSLKKTYNPMITVDGIVGPQIRAYLNTY